MKKINKIFSLLLVFLMLFDPFSTRTILLNSDTEPTIPSKENVLDKGDFKLLNDIDVTEEDEKFDFILDMASITQYKDNFAANPVALDIVLVIDQSNLMMQEVSTSGGISRYRRRKQIQPTLNFANGSTNINSFFVIDPTIEGKFKPITYTSSTNAFIFDMGNDILIEASNVQEFEDELKNNKIFIYEKHTNNAQANRYSRKDNLETAVDVVLAQIKQMNEGNRIAIVGYGNSGYEHTNSNFTSSGSYNGTELLTTNNDPIKYNQINDSVLDNAFIDVKDSESIIYDAIQKFSANENTKSNTYLGMDLARRIIEENEESENQKLVILFTGSAANDYPLAEHINNKDSGGYSPGWTVHDDSVLETLKQAQYIKEKLSTEIKLLSVLPSTSIALSGGDVSEYYRTPINGIPTTDTTGYTLQYTSATYSVNKWHQLISSNFKINDYLGDISEISLETQNDANYVFNDITLNSQNQESNEHYLSEPLEQRVVNAFLSIGSYCFSCRYLSEKSAIKYDIAYPLKLVDEPISDDINANKPIKVFAYKAFNSGTTSPDISWTSNSDELEYNYGLIQEDKISGNDIFYNYELFDVEGAVNNRRLIVRGYEKFLEDQGIDLYEPEHYYASRKLVAKFQAKFDPYFLGGSNVMISTGESNACICNLGFNSLYHSEEDENNNTVAKKTLKNFALKTNDDIKFIENSERTIETGASFKFEDISLVEEVEDNNLLPIYFKDSEPGDTYSDKKYIDGLINSYVDIVITLKDEDNVILETKKIPHGHKLPKEIDENGEFVLDENENYISDSPSFDYETEFLEESKTYKIEYKLLDINSNGFVTISTSHTIKVDTDHSYKLSIRKELEINPLSDSFLFRINSQESQNPLLNNFDIIMNSNTSNGFELDNNGGGSNKYYSEVTIANLPAGEYEVCEIDKWSFKYDLKEIDSVAVDKSETAYNCKTITLPNNENGSTIPVVTFSNKIKAKRFITDEYHKLNEYKEVD